MNETSMNPLNDIRLGEALVKQVYEVFRGNASYRAETMQAPLSVNQKTMAALALACDMKSNPNYSAALNSNFQRLVEQKDAADYIQKVEQKITPGGRSLRHN